MPLIGSFKDQVLVEFPKHVGADIGHSIQSGTLDELKLTPLSCHLLRMDSIIFREYFNVQILAEKSPQFFHKNGGFFTNNSNFPGIFHKRFQILGYFSQTLLDFREYFSYNVTS